jgi:hypothetical protein
VSCTVQLGVRYKTSILPRRGSNASSRCQPNEARLAGSPKPDLKKHRRTRRRQPSHHHHPVASAGFHFVASTIPPPPFSPEPYLNRNEKILVEQSQNQSQTHPRVHLQYPAIRSLSLKQNPPKIKQSPHPKTEETKPRERKAAGAHDAHTVGNFRSLSPPLSIHGAGDVRSEMMR